jgi:hypothetical protein
MKMLHRQGHHLCLELLEGRCVPSTVTNLADAGPGSLRDAIAMTPSGGTVDFQAGLSGTITLTTGELDINKDLTIDGPYAASHYRQRLPAFRGNPHQSCLRCLQAKSSAAAFRVCARSSNTSGWSLSLPGSPLRLFGMNQYFARSSPACWQIAKQGRPVSRQELARGARLPEGQALGACTRRARLCQPSLRSHSSRV